LCGDLELSLLGLDVLIILHEVLGNVGLGHSDGNDLNTRSPVVAVSLQFVLKLLIKVVELIDEDLLEGGLGAELVDFVMDLIKDPGLVVVDGVVLDCLIGVFFPESVDYFNLVESNEDSSLGTARHIVNLIGLYSHLNRLVRSQKGHLHVPARPSHSLYDSSSLEVDSNESFFNLVKALSHDQKYEDNESK
jgi:hypothetical protein